MMEPMENNTALMWGIVIVALVTGAIYFYAVSSPILAPDSGGTATSTP